MPSNNLSSNVSSITLKKFAEGFKSTNVVLNAVDRQVIQGELNPNTGDTVFLKRPMQYRALRTATGDLTAQSPSNLISGKIAATISNYCSVWIEYDQIEQALRLNQWEEILRPAYERMNTELELEMVNYIVKNGSGSLGTIGTAISKWSDVAQVGSFLNSLGLNTGKKFAIMNPYAATALADKQGALQSGNTELIRSAWEDAQIAGNFAGVRALMSNALATRTSGSASASAGVTVLSTPTLTYSTVKDTMQMTVVITGASLAGKSVAVGDQLTFPQTFWINQQTKQVVYNGATPVPFTATVQSVAAASGNNITCVLSCAAVFDTANPQFNVVSRQITAGDNVTIQGAASTVYMPSIFFHESAFAMGTVELPKLQGWDSSVMTSASTGLTMRSTLSSNPITNVQGVRIDILPAFATLIPQGGGQFYGFA
jgi:hypothetical protein